MIPVSKVAQSKRYLNKLLILIVEPEVEIYVNLRQWGHNWFEELNLPDWEHKQYVTPLRYIKWTHKETHALHQKRIDALSAIGRILDSTGSCMGQHLGFQQKV